MSSRAATPGSAVDSGAGTSPTSSLPIVHDLKIVTLASLLIALLTAAASVAGLLFQDEIYPSEALQESFVANDVVNLAVGLPMLLGSMWLARRGRLVGLLFWPGALFYGLYNYLVYLLGMPFNSMYVMSLVIVTLSIYATAGLLVSIDGKAVRARLTGMVPEKPAGVILVVFGVLFMLLAASGIADALASGDDTAGPDLALQTVDFIVCFAWIIGGVLLWRRQALGYVSGTGLLFQASMLFVGLLAVLLLQPLLGDAPLALTDILTVAAMSLVSFIPLGLFLRGVSRSEAGTGKD
ncbi:MAG: hypothetical protein ACK2UH_16525 [Candidatus Promineifilaceae bacterium]